MVTWSAFPADRHQFATRIGLGGIAGATCRRARSGALLAVMVLATLAGSAAHVLAQGGTVTVTGRVMDKSTRSPVADAQVVQASGASTLTDSVGRFVFRGIAPGTIRLIVRADGFPASTFDVTVGGTDNQPVIQLDSTEAGRRAAQPLPEVAVTARPSMGPRFADFERRQKTGRGQYLTREQIARAGHNSLQETLRTLRGVNVDCGGGGGCYIRMARAPMRCLPEYIVDDRVDNIFGIRTPLQDIEALEVYTGPSDVPGEYAGRNAGCGVIVIWTRAGPPSRRP